MSSYIDNFTFRNVVLHNMALQLIFEELIFTLLIKGKNICPIEIKIFYDETSETLEFKAAYGGECYNPPKILGTFT